MHNAQINFSYCWLSILNKYTTHGIEILDVSVWKEVHSWFDKSAFGISVNILISYGDCTTMIDKIIKSFAKRSRNTKSEASNDSPLSGLFILPIPQCVLWTYFWNLDGNLVFGVIGWPLGISILLSQSWCLLVASLPPISPLKAMNAWPRMTPPWWCYAFLKMCQVETAWGKDRVQWARSCGMS